MNMASFFHSELQFFFPLKRNHCFFLCQEYENMVYSFFILRSSFKDLCKCDGSKETIFLKKGISLIDFLHIIQFWPNLYFATLYYL